MKHFNFHELLKTHILETKRIVIVLLTAYSHQARVLPLALPITIGSHTHFSVESLVTTLAASLGVNDTGIKQWDPSKQCHSHFGSVWTSL